MEKTFKLTFECRHKQRLGIQLYNEIKIVEKTFKLTFECRHKQRLGIYHSAFVFTWQLGWLKQSHLRSKCYTFYVIIVIKDNMHTQALTFQNGVFSQDSCYRGITGCTLLYGKKIVLEC